jgi:antitoxin VapB
VNAYTTRTFRSGNSEAVRLPKEIGFGDGVEVEITRSGDVLTIRPKARLTPRELAEMLENMPKPAQIEKRQKIIFPKRKGL